MPQAPDLPGQIGPYRVSEQIGREAGATLYRAVEPAHGRPVVVHLLSARLAEEPALLERFRRDAGALAKAAHPNVLQILGTGDEGGRPYLVTEAFAGAPLDEVLKGRRLNVGEAVTVMKALCRGLAHAHERGVVHGHVWPHAVRVTPGLEDVKLTDFGFARADSLGMTGTLSTGALNLGAFRYLAPEQIDTRAAGAPPADHRADLYSAGVIFHEMLTGRAPGERFALPSQLNSELPSEADVLVLKCLARNPTERYASAIDLLNDLARFEEATRLRLMTELRGIARAGSRGRNLVILGIVALLAVAAIVFFLLRG
jgi:serine/threonine protein kinase